MVRTPVEEFTELVNQFIFWAREHGTAVKLPEKEKRRARLVISRIIGEHEPDDPFAGLEDVLVHTKVELQKRKPEPIVVTALTGKTTVNQKGKDVYNIRRDNAPQKEFPKHKKQKVVAEGFTLCPHCKADVKKGRLSKHGKRCPKAPKQAKPSTHDSRGTGKPSANSADWAKGYYKEDKLLDGSYGTHSRRDGGRFGSMASYDDYGEESFS